MSGVQFLQQCVLARDQKCKTNFSRFLGFEVIPEIPTLSLVVLLRCSIAWPAAMRVNGTVLLEVYRLYTV